MDCRNNVFYSDSAIQGNIYNTMHFFTGGTTPNGGGDAVLGVNWISPGWRKDAPSHAWSGSLSGTTNLITGDAVGANNPHFVDIAAHDYHLLTPSNILDAGGPLSALVPAADAVTMEYLFPQSHQARVQQGTAMDLGALEST
ncbi:MAG: hypothetical protein WCH43_16415, partial [Verrucomicrobiota bacterium]